MSGVVLNTSIASFALNDRPELERYQTMMNKAEVASKIRDYVKGRHPGGVSLKVVGEGIQQVTDWWRVPVRPSAWSEKRYAYYEDLAVIEEELKSREHLNVLIATDEPAIECVA